MKIIKSQSKEAKEFFFKNYKKGSVIDITKTARQLGVTRQTLHNWINQINNK